MEEVSSAQRGATASRRGTPLDTRRPAADASYWPPGPCARKEEDDDDSPKTVDDSPKTKDDSHLSPRRKADDDLTFE